MPGKHDRTGGESPSRLLATGPIVVRGLSRGVKDALRRDAASRHRAAGDAPTTGDTAPEMQEDRVQAADAPSSATTASSPDQEGPIVASEDSDDRTSGEGDRPAESVEGVDGTRSDEAPVDPRAAEEVDLGEEEAGRAEDEPMAARRQDEGLDVFAGLGPSPVPVRSRGARERVSSGVVGVAVLVVLALICAGLIVAVVVKTRNDAELAAREAASYTPPPLTTTAAPAASRVIAIVGDASASSSASGVGASRRWPQLLSAGVDADVDLDASAGAGYTERGKTGSTFVEAAGKVPASARVVLFVGGVADEGVSSLGLARAATQAFAAATDRAPDATVIAVGPLFEPDSSSTEDVARVRATLRSAASIANIRWVDPIESEWVSSATSNADLTAGEERAIASRLRSVVEAATG